MRKIIILSLMFVLATSSVWAVNKSPVKQFGQVRPDKALVYLVRPSHLTGAIRTQFVYADQTFLSAVDNNTYTFAYVEPGQHLIWTNWTSAQKNLEFIAGQTYYLYVFEQVSLLNPSEGEGNVNNPALQFAQSTDKEIATSVSHIEHRYGRAVKKMGKDEYATLPVVENVVAMQPRKGAIQLAKGTPVTLRLMENISSSRVQTGQEVFFEVAAPVVQGGKILIQQGTPVKGIVQHVDHGKTGGVAGTLDVVVSTVNAVDGNSIPLAGQISTKGEDRTDKAVVNDMFMGLTGFFATKSREGYFLSQSQYQTPLKYDVYIVPVSPSPVKTAGAMDVQQQSYTATISDPVTFKPSKKTEVKDIQVELPAEYRWDKLSLISAQGVALPVQVVTTAKTSDAKKQIFVYSGWDLMRFIPLGLNAAEYQLNFLAESGGKNYPVSARLVAVMK